jgi:hypothetical protein
MDNSYSLYLDLKKDIRAKLVTYAILGFRVPTLLQYRGIVWKTMTFLWGPWPLSQVAEVQFA